MKKWLILILVFNCSIALGLTTNETKIVQHAQKGLVEAQRDYKDQRIKTEEAEKRAEEADREAQKANDNAAKTSQNIEIVAKQVDDAYEREKALVTRVNQLQELEKEVNSYWGLGAILYGIKVLLKHLFILGIIVAVLGATLYFLVPAAIPFIKMILSFFGMIFRKIGDLFRKK